MHRVDHFSKWVLMSLLMAYSLFACRKEEGKEDKIYTPVPFLTGRTWVADTITINPPMTFSQLSSADQQSYRALMDGSRSPD